MSTPLATRPQSTLAVMGLAVLAEGASLIWYRTAAGGKTDACHIDLEVDLDRVWVPVDRLAAQASSDVMESADTIGLDQC
jgi:hypothetical protein